MAFSDKKHLYLAFSVAAMALLLNGCAHRPATPPAGPPTGATPTAADQAQQAQDPNAPAQIDPATLPPSPPANQGFFSSLSRRLNENSRRPNIGPCPAVRVLYDASRFVEMNGADRFENVGFTGEINGVRSACRYLGTDPIRVQLRIDAAYGRGPKAEGDQKQVHYWVAVTQVIQSTDQTTGEAGVIDVGPIVRQSFTQTVSFPRGADRTSALSPVMEITIPRASETTSGTNFEVLVGFDLTDAQLQFNRDGRRFRIDAGGNRTAPAPQAAPQQ